MIKAMGLQVLRVIFAFVLGNATAVLVFTLCLWLATVFLPDWQLSGFLALGIVAAAAFPLVFFFGVWFAVFFSWLPALVAAVATEAFQLTSLRWNLGFALAVSAVPGLGLDPSWLDGMSATKAIVSLCYGAGVATGGVVYWAIAGRHAGAWRSVSVSP